MFRDRANAPRLRRFGQRSRQLVHRAAYRVDLVALKSLFLLRHPVLRCAGVRQLPIDVRINLQATGIGAF